MPLFTLGIWVLEIILEFGKENDSNILDNSVYQIPSLPFYSVWEAERLVHSQVPFADSQHNGCECLQCVQTVQICCSPVWCTCWAFNIERERERETRRMGPRGCKDGAWVLPLILLHNSWVLWHSEPEKEAMQRSAPSPSFVLSGGLWVKKLWPQRVLLLMPQWHFTDLHP